VVFMCISLMTDNGEHLFHVLLEQTFVYLLWRNMYSNPVPILKFIITVVEF
jgi:hypothetical protein